MPRTKLVFAALVLLLSVLFGAPKSEADECGDNCNSCVRHDDGGITCCTWVDGEFQGCATIH
jgi:hypothetical protein